ncbi:MAG: hypothetical protein K0Q94_5357 [Paenibacillus sp.]|jgi:hypothetical protein|nr:hypothetical protein [Paenibacillus sp.]
MRNRTDVESLTELFADHSYNIDSVYRLVIQPKSILSAGGSARGVSNDYLPKRRRLRSACRFEPDALQQDRHIGDRRRLLHERDVGAGPLCGW